MVKTRHKITTGNEEALRCSGILKTLAKIANHEEIISIRQLMKLASDWPEILPLVKELPS